MVAPLLVALHLVEEVDLLQATVHRLARPRVLARLLLVPLNLKVLAYPRLDCPVAPHQVLKTHRKECLSLLREMHLDPQNLDPRLEVIKEVLPKDFHLLVAKALEVRRPLHIIEDIFIISIVVT